MTGVFRNDDRRNGRDDGQKQSGSIGMMQLRARHCTHSTWSDRPCIKICSGSTLPPPRAVRLVSAPSWCSRGNSTEVKRSVGAATRKRTPSGKRDFEFDAPWAGSRPKLHARFACLLLCFSTNMTINIYADRFARGQSRSMRVWFLHASP